MLTFFRVIILADQTKNLTIADENKQATVCEMVETWKLENGIYEADKEALKSKFFAGLNAQIREERN